MSQQCKRVLFHLCDIVSTVWPIGSALSNHWTARHCHFRPLRGRDATDECETCSIGSSKYKNLKLRKEEEKCCSKSCSYSPS